ncbi:VOC family protein [Halobacillus litoralis]|uniref:VOC family protein n=1 Tax=Halobacillus litoralis TaxID=45668 RepID=UPI001CFE9911|nr:VOC family protein [Halobacillus litoralis]
MIFELTNQLRVSNINEGISWYEQLFQKQPDFIPHEGFVEWEMVTGSWLQIAEGVPSKESGPLRLGVTNIEAQRSRVMKDLGVEEFEIHSREEVPVKWGTFLDPWGNSIGFYEYLDKKEEKDRIDTVFNRG